MTGVCGAALSTVTARNLARSVAGGVAAHADHGRAMALLLGRAAAGDVAGLQVKDVAKLRALAEELGVEGASDDDVDGLAGRVAEALLGVFGSQGGELPLLRRAPAARRERWRAAGLAPRGIDREIVEVLHRTTMGTDQSSASLVDAAMRCAISDGWGGAMIASDVSDILFGSPAPVASRASLGVLSETEVNVLVHGHNPLMAEMLVVAAAEPELLEAARAAGATGINLAGVCCSANEVLSRHGVPAAGSFLDQEIAVATGAVDAMVVDVQCIMPSLPGVAERFHTRLLSTDAAARIEGTTHIDVAHEPPLEAARRIVSMAIEAFGERGETRIPQATTGLIAGFTDDSIARMLGGAHLPSFRPLNEAIIDGRLQGVVAIVGCNNPRSEYGRTCALIAESLMRANVLVVNTGCAAIACGAAGAMDPEAREDAGPILEVVCKSVGIPPALHMGSCVDNSRVLLSLARMVEAGGLGQDIDELPVAGVCPEWMCEKALAIGAYFAATGVYTVFGVGSPVAASPDAQQLLGPGLAQKVGGSLIFEPDPERTVELVLERLRDRRERLGLGAHRDSEIHDIDKRKALIWWKNRLRDLQLVR